MPAAHKRSREEAATGADTEQSSKGGAGAASAAIHSAAASSTPAAPAAVAPASRSGPVPAAAAAANGDDDDDEEEEEEQTEYVVVRMPASLVKHMREAGDGAVTIEGLDTAHPHFDATYTLPARGVVTQRFVGSYEYSVGTQLLWRIHDEPPLSKAARSPSPASAASPARSASPTKAAAALTASPVPFATGGLLQPPLPRGTNAPHVDFVGKTWKRLVFARQR